MTTYHLFTWRRFIQPGFLFVMGIIGLASNVLAQQQNTGVLEEITVTARKINESLQEVPVAVTAFTAADLSARGITSLDNIASYTPNVEFFASGISGKNSGQAYIRGVGQFDYLLTTDPGVGVYVDGVYLARSLGNILDMVDIDRVEILRGPQGTLYGKNTVGGAINVITRRPTKEFEGNIQLGTGSYDRVDARANISGPIIKDVLNGKLAFSTKNADGFGRRPLVGDRAGEEQNYGLQTMLEWDPADNVNVLFSADYTKVDETFSHHHTEEINEAAPLVGLYNALAGPLAPLHGVPLQPYDSRWITANAFDDNSTDSNFNEQEIWGVSGIITWEVGGLTVKSITSYREMDLSFGTDPDGSPVVVIDEIDVNRQNQVSQELQITGVSFDDRLNWVLGVYYLSEDANADMTIRTYEGIYQALEALPTNLFPLGPVVCPAPLPAPCAGGAGNPVNIGLDIGRFTTSAQDTKSFAVYGQGSYDITEKLSLTYGVRYTDEKKDFTYSFVNLQSGFQLVPETTVSDSWTDVSHRIGIDYQWTDDLMTYFSASKGFKSGGFNGRGRSTNEITSYDPEEMWSYEIGFKSEWLDRRLRLNGAAFYNDYTDLQFSLSSVDGAGTQVIVVGNVGAAEVQGFELEAIAFPVEQFQISASIGHLDAKYTEVAPGADITTDHELIGSPKWSGSVSGEYRIPLQNEWGSLALRADYAYRSKVYFDAINTESGAQKSYGLLNLRGTWTSENEKWSLAGGVSNVTDKTYKVMGIGVLNSLGFASSIYGPPRQWFLQANYHF